MLHTLAGLLLLAGATTIAGRMVARVARVAWLDRTHPDVLPLHAALGTALLTSLCATASHAGLGQRAVAPLVAVAFAALLVWGWRVRVPHSRTARCRASGWLPLAIALGSAVAVGLLPVVWWHSFNPFNDAFYYDAMSDWLLDHGVSSIAPVAPTHPALAIVSTLQRDGLRLGTSYGQALLTGVTGASHAILLFYAVSCWGFILLAGCLFSLGRRVFRMAPWLCAAAVVTTVCVPAAASHALQSGFQAQLQGLAALVALICVTASMLPRRNWTAGGCFVTASLLAWQTSVYSELLPVAGAALLAWLLVTARRAARRGARRAWTGAIVRILVAYALLANVEAVRAAAAIPMQMGAVVGWHIDLDRAAWAGLLTGSSTYPELTDPPSGVNPMVLVAAPALPLALCLLALIRRPTRQLLHGTRAVFLSLGLLMAYYALIAHDPWSGDVFHTWSVFKLTEWLHPLIILAAWAGLARFVRTPRAARLAAAIAGLMLLIGLPLHVRYARMVSFRPLSLFAGSDRPLTELARLSWNMERLAGQQLYVVTRPHLTNPHFVELLGYFGSRSRVAGRWTGCTFFSPSVPAMAPDRTDRMPATGPLTLLCHQPHFLIPGGRDLGCGVEAVEAADEPVLCQVWSEFGRQHTAEGDACLWIGAQPTTLVIFAPRAGRVRLAFSAGPGPGPESAVRHLKARAGGEITSATIAMGNGPDLQPASLTLEVVAGVNEVLLACTGRPDQDPTDAASPGSPSLSLSAPALTFE